MARSKPSTPTPQWAMPQESWLYFPTIYEGGKQTAKVCREDGYDFAVLHWMACSLCRRALVAKIRVTDPWQHRGYASRMMTRALTGCEDYTWTTTPQSKDGRRFFTALTKRTGIAFPANSAKCDHVTAAFAQAELPDPIRETLPDLPPAARRYRFLRFRGR